MDILGPLVEADTFSHAEASPLHARRQPQPRPKEAVILYSVPVDDDGLSDDGLCDGLCMVILELW